MQTGNRIAPFFDILPPLNLRPTLLAGMAFFSAAIFAQEPAKPILYNYLEGDGGVELDRAIKDAYGPNYTIINTTRSDGYVEPAPVSGEMPSSPKNEIGQRMAGYVLVSYLVTAEGLVADPRVLKTTNDALSRVCLEAMLGWRFTPGKLKGAPVATTAAQEFTFGPVGATSGYEKTGFVVYQPQDVLIKRMPPSTVVSAYLARLEAVAHNFFVGTTTPETFHIVVVARPGGLTRVWLISSIRPGTSRELAPLKKLIEAVPPLDPVGGPVILALSGKIAGGDRKEAPDADGYRYPVPQEWRELVRAMPEPPPFSSDAFLDLLWPGGN